MRFFKVKGNYLYYVICRKEIPAEIAKRYEYRVAGDMVIIRCWLNFKKWEKEIKKMVVDETVKEIDSIFGLK